MCSLPVKIKMWSIVAKYYQKRGLDFSNGASFHMKIKLSLKYLVTDCL